jgi:hypothetical protein
VAVLSAVINVIVGRGARRAYWLGFAIFGGAYLAICSTPAVRDAVCPRLVTEAIFDMIYPFTAPGTAQPPSSTATISWVLPAFNAVPTPGSPNPAPVAPQWSPGWGSNVLIGPTNPGYAVQTAPTIAWNTTQLPPQPNPWSAWTAPDRSIGVGFQIGSISLVSSEAFRQIGHSLSALLVATLGGVFARHRYHVSARDGQPREAPLPLP